MHCLIQKILKDNCLNHFVLTIFHFDETISRCRPTFMETFQLYNFCNFGATLLGFGTVHSAWELKFW